MTKLDLETLGRVTGGVATRCATSGNDALAQSLTQIQSTLSSLTSNNNNNQNNLLFPLAVMFAMRRQTVVSAGGATVVG